MQLTALQIIRQAALELGLRAPNEVATSLENTGQQLLALLNSAGNDLVVAYTWQELNRTHTFSSNVGVDLYALPTLFKYTIDQTFWNSSDNEPVRGPLDPQAWQQLIAGGITLPTSEVYRMQQDKIQLFPVPGAVANYTYQYVTEGWAYDGADPTIFKALINSDTDVAMLDGNLLVKALKVKMWNAKGLDTTLLLTEFSQLFGVLTGKSKGAQVLSLAPRRQNTLLSSANVPEGSW